MAEYAGIGTQLQWGNGASPEVFTTVAQVGDIGGPNLKAKTYDTTTHDNVLDGYSDFITGLKDGGQVTFKVFFDPNNATHKDSSGGLLNIFNTNLASHWKIIPANVSPSVTWSFTAVITDMKFGYKVDGVQEADCTMQVKGKPTLA